MRARLLTALESESGYGDERTDGEDAERRREGMTEDDQGMKRTPRELLDDATQRRGEERRGPKVKERWEWQAMKLL